MKPALPARDHQTAAFFGLTLLLMLPLYLLGALGPDLTKVLPIQLPVAALTFICPALSALWLVWRKQGDVRPLLRGVTRGVSPLSWGLAWLLMPAALTLCYLLQRLSGQVLPAATLPDFLPALLVLSLLGALGEELGWTAYATPRLQHQYGALRGALLLGAFWAVIHIIPYAQAHRSAAWIVWQCLGTVALRVLMTWLWAHSAQRLLPSVVFHAMINVSEFSFPQHGSHYDPLVSAGVFAALALLCWRSWPVPSTPPLAT